MQQIIHCDSPGGATELCTREQSLLSLIALFLLLLFGTTRGVFWLSKWVWTRVKQKKITVTSLWERVTAMFCGLSLDLFSVLLLQST